MKYQKLLVIIVLLSFIIILLKKIMFNNNENFNDNVLSELEVMNQQDPTTKENLI